MGLPHDDWACESVDPSQTSSTNSSFKRVVNQVNHNAKCRLCIWGLTAFFACNIMFMLIFYDKVVNSVAVGHMVLSDGGGPKYEAWKESTMPVYYKVRVFNLTNPEAFMKGDRPRLKECGPYSYQMIEEKINITFHDNDTVTYRTRPTYIYEPMLSTGSEDDIIWTVNIPLVNAADAVKSNVVSKTVIQVAQKIHGFKTVRKLSVRELLWGYQSHVMDWARTLQDVPYPHQRFGLLVGFNNTPQEPYTMYTGANNPEKMNAIYAWNGKTELNFWADYSCNEIKGTDASGFHPGVKASDKLFIFNGQLCRSMPLVYQKTVMHSGVETFRFVPPSDTFSYGKSHPENDCYCGKGGCPPRGLLDMKPCYYGAAVAFSFPHFYQADPKLRHVVRGLHPDPELHGTQFDIYPKLGVPLRVKLRMQMNVVIDRNQALQRDRHFDVVFPVFWFEAGIDSLPKEMVGKLKMAQDLPPVVKTTSITVSTAFSLLFLILLLFSSFASWCGISEKHSRTSTPDHLPDTPWPAKHTKRPETKKSSSFLDASGYTRGSLNSLEPGDAGSPLATNNGGPIEVYPKLAAYDVNDNGKGGLMNNNESTLDRPPPAYSNSQTKTSFLSSVDVHNSDSVSNASSELLDNKPVLLEDNNDDPSLSSYSIIGTPLVKSESVEIDTARRTPLATSSPQPPPDVSAMNSSVASEDRPPPLESEL